MEARLSQPAPPARSVNGKAPVPESGGERQGEGRGDFLLASNSVEAVREGAHAKLSLGPVEIVEIIELPGNDRCFECVRASVAHPTARVAKPRVHRAFRCRLALVAMARPWPPLAAHSQPHPLQVRGDTRRSLGLRHVWHAVVHRVRRGAPLLRCARVLCPLPHPRRAQA